MSAIEVEIPKQMSKKQKSKEDEEKAKENEEKIKRLEKQMFEEIHIFPVDVLIEVVHFLITANSMIGEVSQLVKDKKVPEDKKEFVETCLSFVTSTSIEMSERFAKCWPRLLYLGNTTDSLIDAFEEEKRSIKELSEIKKEETEEEKKITDEDITKRVAEHRMHEIDIHKMSIVDKILMKIFPELGSHAHILYARPSTNSLKEILDDYYGMLFISIVIDRLIRLKSLLPRTEGYKEGDLENNAILTYMEHLFPICDKSPKNAAEFAVMMLFPSNRLKIKNAEEEKKMVGVMEKFFLDPAEDIDFKQSVEILTAIQNGKKIKHVKSDGKRFILEEEFVAYIKTTFGKESSSFKRLVPFITEDYKKRKQFVQKAGHIQLECIISAVEYIFPTDRQRPPVARLTSQAIDVIKKMNTAADEYQKEIMKREEEAKKLKEEVALSEGETVQKDQEIAKNIATDILSGNVNDVKIPEKLNMAELVASLCEQSYSRSLAAAGEKVICEIAKISEASNPVTTTPN